jgi:fermentation-respiration switch protein FrsA (DUF1100 family)
MRRRLRTWPKVALVLGVAGGGWWGLRIYEQRMLYAPAPVLAATPARIGLKFEDVMVASADGETIHGWFVAGGGGEPGNAAVLLFLHGGRGNMGDRLQKLQLFHQAGLGVLMIDYRGYGKSTGRPSERGLGLDALAAYFHLREQRGVAAERLFVYGEGLGAAVAVDLATKVRTAGLILEGAPVSAVEWLWRRRPGLPWRGLASQRFETLQKIGRVNAPVLLLHSADDEVVAFSDAERLLAAARTPKELVRLRGSHEQCFFDSFELYYGKVTEFVARHGGGNSAAAGPTRAGYRTTPGVLAP